MTYFDPEYIETTQEPPRNWLNMAMLRIWCAGLRFLLGLPQVNRIERIDTAAQASRSRRKRAGYALRRAYIPGRGIAALKPLLPRGLDETLSRTQVLERSTRISSMGRFQIYDFLYNRSDFWRIGAMKLRAGAPLISSSSSPDCAFPNSGLSGAHEWPD